MKELDFWRSDRPLGFAAALVVRALSGRKLMQNLGRNACDTGARATAREPVDRIAVSAIDARSVASGARLYRAAS